MSRSLEKVQIVEILLRHIPLVVWPQNNAWFTFKNTVTGESSSDEAPVLSRNSWIQIIPHFPNYSCNWKLIWKWVMLAFKTYSLPIQNECGTKWMCGVEGKSCVSCVVCKKPPMFTSEGRCHGSLWGSRRNHIWLAILLSSSTTATKTHPPPPLVWSFLSLCFRPEWHCHHPLNTSQEPEGWVRSTTVCPRAD